MKFKPGTEDSWKRVTDIPSDWDLAGYCKAIVDFSVRWADAMEKRIREGEGLVSVESCAETAFSECDSEVGITGNQYACVVMLLSEYWILGEPLRKWHNKKYDHHGPGVVNPAILMIANGPG